MKLDRDRATHLLVRTGFSATDAELAPLVGKTRDEAIAQLLAGMRTDPFTLPPKTASSLLAFDAPQDIDKAALARELAQEIGADPNDLGVVGRELLARLMHRSESLKAWWVSELVATPSPLTERVVLLLSNHITSSLKKVRDPRLMFRQNALFRRHAGGSYADLLRAVVDDAALLIYLDAVNSDKDAPNENLARELLELFTLGEGHYGETDVKAAARALTGRRVRRFDGAVKERRRRRDDGSKTFLGTSGDLRPRDLVERLLEHPRTAMTLVEKLWRDLVDETLDVGRVSALARAFQASGYQMKPLVFALLREDAFWKTPHGLVRSPLELVACCARTWPVSPEGDVEVGRPEVLARHAKRMGQDPFDPPNVKGWPVGLRSVTTATLVERDRFLRRYGSAVWHRTRVDVRAALLDPLMQTR